MSEAERLRKQIDTLADLAAEHMQCSGCPTPWWLVNWLTSEVADRLAAQPAHGDNEAALRAVLALHPRKDNPTSGCCARPRLCDGHAPICNGREHGMNRPDWPCPTASVVLAALSASAEPECGEGR